MHLSPIKRVTPAASAQQNISVLPRSSSISSFPKLITYDKGETADSNAAESKKKSIWSQWSQWNHWSHSNLLEATRVHLESLGVTWSHPESCRVTRSHPESLRITRIFSELAGVMRSQPESVLVNRFICSQYYRERVFYRSRIGFSWSEIRLYGADAL